MEGPTVDPSKQCLKSTNLQLPNPRVVALLPSKKESENKKKQKPTWSRHIEFVLSGVGYAVGLGNIWRFPYLCYNSGGGAFLIPYVFLLVLCGIPLLYMETSIGQFGSLGSISTWKISPLFKGLGFGMAILCIIVCVYYNVIIAWSIYYMYLSYSVPWSSCGNSWNTLGCVSSKDFTQPTNISNNSISPSEFMNSSRMASSEEFWLFYVLRQSTGIEDLGELQWPLVITLFTAWFIVFICISKGIKTSGKVVYVTATLPYFILVALLVRGLTLPGSWNGITFFLKPKWEKLLTFRVWGDAASQVFYSSGVAWGGILTMASHNKFKNNVLRDTLVISFINYGTSILAGFVVFSLLGFMAYETGKAIEDVVAQGPGLAFVVYPEAISRLPLPSFWAFLFFFMLLAVGVDTEFATFETIVSALVDEYPELLQNKQTLFTAALCLISFLLGLPCVTQGGIYVVQLMDWYSAAFSLMFFSLFEAIIVAWIYGVDRFALDISLMTKRYPSTWWKLCWCFFTPAIIIALLLFSFINHTVITYDDYVYPEWSVAIGWILATCSIAPVPLFAVWTLIKEKGSFKQRLIKSLRPSPDWGPASEENRLLYRKSLNIQNSRFGQKNLELQHICLDTFSGK